MHTSEGNLAPNVQSPPHRLKTFKKKRESFISQWLIREDSIHVNYVELFTIIEDIALLIQSMHIRKQETCWLENDLNMQ